MRVVVSREQTAGVVNSFESLDIAGRPQEVMQVLERADIIDPIPQTVTMAVNLIIPQEVQDMLAQDEPAPTKDCEVLLFDAKVFGNGEGVTHPLPLHRVSSTARKGSKWMDKVSVGDVVEMRSTGTDQHLGYAAVVLKEFMSLEAVLDNADHNHIAFSEATKLTESARAALETALSMAYGNEQGPFTMYTVLHLLPLND